MPNKLTQDVAKVFRKGLSFGAALQIASSDANSEPLATTPVTIIAVSGQPAIQAFWGNCIFDLSGFSEPSAPIPIDFNHDGGAPIGVADQFQITPQGLSLSGKLTPFTKDDEASQVIYQASQGIPFQASVRLSLDGLQTVDVADGQSMTVNGRQFVGPGTVFTQWSIEGVGVLLYGADKNTSVQFSDQGARELAGKFQADFGSKGLDWFIEGRSYDEACRLNVAELKSNFTASTAQHAATMKAKDADIAALTIERDRLKAKSQFRRGQAMPVPVRPTTDEPEKPKSNAVNFGRSAGWQSVVDAIQAKMKSVS